MEKRVLIFCTVLVILVTAGFTFALTYFRDFHTAIIDFQRARGIAIREDVITVDIQDNSILLDPSEVMGHSIRMELPTTVNMEEISIIQDYLQHTVQLTIPGIDETYLNDFPIIGSSDHVSDVTFVSRDGVGMMEIELDGIYETRESMEGRYFYLDFPKPREVYDKIIVVDAGHGGRDAGASKGSILEKDINLSMLLELKKILDEVPEEQQIGVYYTRTTDANLSLDQRVGLANDLDADLFLSIHQNSTSSGRTSGINGTEVMYRTTDETEGSYEFASVCLEKLLEALGSESKGLVAGDEILIIRKAKMPVALAEIGFITNERERDLLLSKEYQESAANALYQALMASLP